MKRTVTAAIMMSLIVSSVAMADSGKGRDQGSKPQGYSQDSRRDDRRDDWRDDRRDDWRNDRRDDWRDHRRDDWRYDRRDDWRDHRRDDRRFDHRYCDHDRGNHYGRIRAGEYRRPWGYRAHHWRRGERLPRAYYARPYVVNDYRACHLRPPPRGAHWVRVNNDALLAAIATGVVLDVVYNRFY